MSYFKGFAYNDIVEVVSKKGLKFAYFTDLCYIKWARERGIMKKIYNYTFQLVCVYILVLSCFSISNFEIKIDYYNNNIHNINDEKILESTLLVKNSDEEDAVVEEEKESINKVEEDNTSTEEKNNNDTEEVSIKVEETVNIIDTSSFAVLSQEIINLSHYGHDCYGCTTGYTASGYYVGDGRIYYQDPTFGSVRVVAADNKYPLGTVIRLGYHGTSITAIVLDRGGGIGDGKKFQIDLLTSSNSEAYQLGTVYDTSLEVLRLGY